MPITFSNVQTRYDEGRIACRTVDVLIDGVEAGGIERAADSDWWSPDHELEPLIGDFGERTVAAAKRAVRAALSRAAAPAPELQILGDEDDAYRIERWQDAVLDRRAAQ